MTDPMFDVTREKVGIELISPYQIGKPNAADLSQLLVEIHPTQEVVNSLFDRE